MILHVQVKEKSKETGVISKKLNAEVLSSFTPNNLWLIDSITKRPVGRVQQCLEVKCEFEAYSIEKYEVYMSGYQVLDRQGTMQFISSSSTCFVMDSINEDLEVEVINGLGKTKNLVVKDTDTISVDTVTSLLK